MTGKVSVGRELKGLADSFWDHLAVPEGATLDVAEIRHGELTPDTADRADGDTQPSSQATHEIMGLRLHKRMLEPTHDTLPCNLAVVIDEARKSPGTESLCDEVILSPPIGFALLEALRRHAGSSHVHMRPTREGDDESATIISMTPGRLAAD